MGYGLTRLRLVHQSNSTFLARIDMNHDQERAQAHGVNGEDKEVHDREEELKRMLRDAEQRCRDLRNGIERAERKTGKRESTAISVPPTSPVASSPKAERINLNPVGTQVTKSSRSQGEARRRCSDASHET